MGQKRAPLGLNQGDMEKNYEHFFAATFDWIRIQFLFNLTTKFSNFQSQILKKTFCCCCCCSGKKCCSFETQGALFLRCPKHFIYSFLTSKSRTLGANSTDCQI